jgi:hypothetical protein
VAGVANSLAGIAAQSHKAKPDARPKGRGSHGRACGKKAADLAPIIAESAATSAVFSRAEATDNPARLSTTGGIADRLRVVAGTRVDATQR